MLAVPVEVVELVLPWAGMLLVDRVFLVLETMVVPVVSVRNVVAVAVLEV